MKYSYAIMGLIRSSVEKNDAEFRSYAKQIASMLEKDGDILAAEDIKSVLNPQTKKIENIDTDKENDELTTKNIANEDDEPGICGESSEINLVKENSQTEKPKRHRRTKAEIELARKRVLTEDDEPTLETEKPKRHRRTKAEMELIRKNN